MPSEASNRRLILDLDFCAETDFYLSWIWAVFSVEKSEKYANLRACSSDMYATFIQFEHFHLSKSGASIKFVFTNCSVLTDSAFYFALPLLLCGVDFFVPLNSSSFEQCPEVLRMIVSPLNMWVFDYVLTPLMKFMRSLVWRKFSRIKRGGWYNMIKESESSKLGDAPVVHPCIYQEDSSV